MTISTMLPCTVFKKLILPNSYKVISSVPIRLKHDDALDNLEESELSALDQKKVKIIDVTVNSMRLDLILKAGLNVSRNKIESAFYGSKIRKNGQRALKKSESVNIGDEIDLVNTEKAPKNPNLLNVARLKILDAELEDNKYTVKMMRDKNLIIEDETTKY